MIMKNHDQVYETVEPRFVKAVSGIYFLSLSSLLAQLQLRWPPSFITKHVFTSQHFYLLSPLHRILFCSLCIKDLLLYSSAMTSSKSSFLTTL